MTQQPLDLAWGGWPSPITPDIITAGAPRRDFPQLANGNCYWQESRPDEGGRITVVERTPDGATRDLLPYPLSARSKVNEYGGRSWLVDGNRLYFVLQDDQRLYRLDLAHAGASPIPLTPDDVPLRFADLVIDRARARLLCVMEEHVDDREPACALVAVATEHCQPPRPLVTGADFYASPRLSPDGDQLCWLSWNHPNMPWDGTRLFCAALDSDGLPAAPHCLAGGDDESIFQPQWSPDGELWFVSDRSGWWNLYRHSGGHNLAVLPRAAEFGLPLWSLGMSTYGFIGRDRVLCTFCEHGLWQLAMVDASGNLDLVGCDYQDFSSLVADPDRGEAALVAASPVTAGDVVAFNPSKGLSILVDASERRLNDFISAPEPIHFPTGDGDQAHGFYYPPRNPHYRGPASRPPPLVVMCHGGPTGATSTALNYKIQYWTSRGFALLDVNYRGSTGYGRAYRQKLDGRWGLADVEDVAAGVRHLTARGLADPLRTVIRGSSAGGYTVLAALTFTNVFRAGASLYGIGNLETLATDTHKFESRYLDRLVGPYPAARETYRQRSPAFHTDQLNCPIIFLQGLEDKVVPPSQAREMVSALENKGIPVAYITFHDEGHGFRKAENIRKAMEAELYFYRTVLDIHSSESLPAIPIANHR